MPRAAPPDSTATLSRSLHSAAPRPRPLNVHLHNASGVLFRLCANTGPQRDSLFTNGPADALAHATLP